MKGTQPDLGAVLVTRWDVHTDMRPRTFPELPAISGETKGPGSPDAGRAPSAAPGTIPSFTARSGGQGQRQCRPELTLQVPRPFRKIFILLDGNVSFFPCSKQTIQNILSLFLDDIIVIQSIRYCTLPPSGAPGAVARCWPLHALSPTAVHFVSSLPSCHFPSFPPDFRLPGMSALHGQHGSPCRLPFLLLIRCFQFMVLETYATHLSGLCPGCE